LLLLLGTPENRLDYPPEEGIKKTARTKVISSSSYEFNFQNKKGAIENY
jgi:hypothetical protein